MKIIQIMALGVCILICTARAAKSRTYMDTISNKQKVLSFYKQIVGQRKAELIPEFVVEDYKQHNPTVKQGRAGITEMINYLKTLPPPPEGAKSPIIRAIQEGDFVVTHLDIQFMGKRMAVIDLFKLKDGMLTEHWDAIETLPDESGKAITSTNGTNEIDKSALGENSRHIVSLYYKAVINKTSSGQLIHPGYVEHDRVIAEGGKILTDHIAERQDVKLHKIIAEGDFVVVQSQFNRSGKWFVLYEIFRVANGKISEHWGVEQAIPDGVQPEDMF